jgi:tetratricopeptide (TPR) repeat protein
MGNKKVGYILLLVYILVFLNINIGFAHLGAHDELELINRKLEENPEDKTLLVKRAMLYRIENHTHKSLQELNMLVKRFPKDREIYFQRALTWKALENYKQAESDLNEILKDEKKDWSLFAERALVRERLQKFDLALQDYFSGSEFATSETFFIDFGNLQKKKGCLTEAAHAFRKGLQHNPDSVVLTKSLVDVETQLKNFDKAHQLVDRVIEKRHFKTPWLILKGKIYDASDQNKLAYKVWKLALDECDRKMRSDRGRVIYKTYYAEVLLAMGRIDEADDILSSALQEIPNYKVALELKERIKVLYKTLKDSDPNYKGK